MILKEMGLFATPENMDALNANLEVFPKGQVRVAAATMMGVTWNFCAEATKDLLTPAAAKIALCLNAGIDGHKFEDNGFDEWFAGSNMERLNRVVMLSKELAKAVWDFESLPDSYVLYQLVKDDLADFIAGSYVGCVEPLSDEMILNKFRELLVEGKKYIAEQLTAES